MNIMKETIMKKRFRVALLTLAVVGLLAGVVAISSNVTAGVGAAAKDSVPVFDFQDHGVAVMNPQNRGTSDLVRTVDGISMNIDTTDLPVGANSVWWVIFNDPSKCSDGECGENDVLPPPGNVAAGVSVLWAGSGAIVGPDRMAHFSSSLGLGEDSAPGELLWGPALTNPMGAEVHLIVRYHGPAAWEDPVALTGQLSTFGGSCDDFACYDAQAAIHKP